MGKVFLIFLTVIVVLGLFAATGYAGYRFGYAQGAQTTANSDDARLGLRTFDHVNRAMPMQRFGFEHEWGRGGFPMRLGLFAPLLFLGKLGLLTLIVLLIYWLFTRSGWQLTRATQTTTPPPPNTENK